METQRHLDNALSLQTGNIGDRPERRSNEATDGRCMTPDELSKYGKILYGYRHWQAELSDALAVSPRTIRRWLFNQTAIPDGAADDIQVLLRNKYKVLTELLRTTYHESGPTLPTDSLEQH
jgi:hypothetical protein